MNSLIMLYVPTSSKQEAYAMAKHLIERRLIACANILPAESLYQWKGSLAQEHETILIAKTIAEKYQDAQNEILKMHSYQTPCIITIPIEANKEYADWVRHQIVPSQ